MVRADVMVRPNMWNVALRGAGVALALTFAYALAFLLYAMLRSFAVVVGTVNEGAGFLATLFATWFSLAIPTLTIAALFAILAVPLGAVTAVLIVWASARWNKERNPNNAIALGAALTFLIAFLLTLLLQLGGMTFDLHYWDAWALWFVLPLLVYVAAGGAASWKWNQQLRGETAG
jgi:ABC-type Fe3+-siderophore transport system permease subunit